MHDYSIITSNESSLSSLPNFYSYFKKLFTLAFPIIKDELQKLSLIKDALSRKNLYVHDINFAIATPHSKKNRS